MLFSCCYRGFLLQPKIKMFPLQDWKSLTWQMILLPRHEGQKQALNIKKKPTDLFLINRTYRTQRTHPWQNSHQVFSCGFLCGDCQFTRQPFQSLIFIQISFAWLLATFNLLVINIFGQSLIVVFLGASK